MRVQADSFVLPPPKPPPSLTPSMLHALTYATRMTFRSYGVRRQRSLCAIAVWSNTDSRLDESGE
jgi:hypothetical protein